MLIYLIEDHWNEMETWKRSMVGKLSDWLQKKIEVSIKSLTEGWIDECENCVD